MIEFYPVSRLRYVALYPCKMLFCLLRALVFVGLYLGFSACSSEHEISFRVCGDLKVPGHIDAVRLVILDDLSEELRSGLIELESSDIVILDDESNSIIKQVKQLHKEINDSKHKLSKFL